ncbi:hypothetical protein GLT81_00280 [Nanohaloarchaea archaeon]|nr:hypothetical protein [Candidatus Nanohaloarchaea archaeon]
MPEDVFDILKGQLKRVNPGRSQQITDEENIKETYHIPEHSSDIIVYDYDSDIISGIVDEYHPFRPSKEYLIEEKSEYRSVYFEASESELENLEDEIRSSLTE